MAAIHSPAWRIVAPLPVTRDCAASAVATHEDDAYGPGVRQWELATPMAFSRKSPPGRGLGYRDIAAALEDAIRFGRYKLGEKLPTEEELAGEFNVTRLTIRRALSLLNEAGLLDRKPRRGTVVSQSMAGPSVISPLSQYTSQAERMSTRFLGRTEHRADEALAKLFDVDIESAIVELLFTRERDGQPIAHVAMQLPPWVAAFLPPGEIKDARQVGRALADAGLVLHRLRQSVGAQNADPELARRLGIAPGNAVLRFTRVKRDRRGRAFQRMVSLFRADLYEYDMEFIDSFDIETQKKERRGG
jgi:GntR family transcriptional regulator